MSVRGKQTLTAFRFTTIKFPKSSLALLIGIRMLMLQIHFAIAFRVDVAGLSERIECRRECVALTVGSGKHPVGMNWLGLSPSPTCLHRGSLRPLSRSSLEVEISVAASLGFPQRSRCATDASSSHSKLKQPSAGSNARGYVAQLKSSTLVILAKNQFVKIG